MHKVVGCGVKCVGRLVGCCLAGERGGANLVKVLETRTNGHGGCCVSRSCAVCVVVCDIDQNSTVLWGYGGHFREKMGTQVVEVEAKWANFCKCFFSGKMPSAALLTKETIFFCTRSHQQRGCGAWAR